MNIQVQFTHVIELLIPLYERFSYFVTTDNAIWWMNNVIGVLALATLMPYLDRLRVMQPFKHRASVIVMHLALAIWLGYLAFIALVHQELQDPHSLLAVIASAMWIVISHKTWGLGPPEHVRSGFDESQAVKHQ